MLLLCCTLAASDAPEWKYEKAVASYEAKDQESPPADGGIMCIGSSTFTRWKTLTEDLAPLPVYNRAFGGSRTGDQLARFAQVVPPYAPKVIVYYCGSNDLKSGDEPAAIFDRFRQFSERVRRTLPNTHLIYVTATRSPDRVARWGRVDHYNGLVRSLCESTPRHTFIDINPALVDTNGAPRLDLYRSDKLHFHPQAYVEFARVIRPVLEDVWKQAGGSSAASRPE
jgi:lysophospholipase L1-like esterase